VIAIRPSTDYDTLRRLGVEAGLEPGIVPGVQSVAGWVAVEGGRTVGGVMLERLAGRLLVGWLWVDAACRRRGLGGRLVETAVAEARQLGVAALWAVARVPAVFLRHDFVRVPAGPDADLLLGDCLDCPQYDRTCRPAPVVRRLD
jgi:N-acetylglutamate synthase-like GNAT family acetyltransferase